MKNGKIGAKDELKSGNLPFSALHFSRWENWVNMEAGANGQYFISCKIKPPKGGFFINKYVLHTETRKNMEKQKAENDKLREFLTKEEQNLFEYIRKVNYGELRIIIMEGKPIRIEEIKRSIQL